MTDIKKVLLRLDRDTSTGFMQVSIGDGSTSYRLMGPKYWGKSLTVKTIQLSQRDVENIRQFLDAAYPLTVTMVWVRELLFCYRHTHAVDTYKLDEVQERIVIEKLAELGISVKEGK